MAYQAPEWVNGAPPAISSDNLRNLCETVEDTQILMGNGIPSESEGAAGQFYLDLTDRGGFFDLYQCVSISNGNRKWVTVNSGANEDVTFKVEALRRRVASHSAAIIAAVPRNNVYEKYIPTNASDVPNFDDYTTERHIHFIDKYAPICAATYRPPLHGGILDVMRNSKNLSGAQYFYPVSGTGEVKSQIWYRAFYYRSSGTSFGAWECINRVDESKLDWRTGG
jgi:hypothetical protein